MCDTNIGLTYNPQNIVDDGVIVLRSGNIIDGKIDYDDLVKVNLTIPENKLAYVGDILICVRNGSKRLVGKAAVVDKDGISFGAFMAVVRSAIVPYIFKVISSPYFRRTLIDDVGTTTINQITQSMLKNFLVPLPPLAEQKRIVEKLNALLSEVNALAKDERELVELEKNFPRRMKNSILQAAITGKLTEQLSSDGDARDLLRKIRAEKAKLIADKKIKADKPLPPISDEEIPFDLPDNWCWCRLGEVCEINPRNRLDDETIDATFLPMTAINDGYNNSYNPLVKPWLEIKNGFTHFADGDVIFAKITPCFQNRKSAVVNNLTNGIGAGTTELYVLRSYGKQVSEKYLLYFLKNQQFIADGVATMKGTAGQQRIKRNFVTNYLFPLPPLAEQERIVERVEELLPLCEI